MRPPTILIPVNYCSCPPQTCITTQCSLSIWLHLLPPPSLPWMTLPPSLLYTVEVQHTHKYTHIQFFCQSFCLDDPFLATQGLMGCYHYQPAPQYQHCLVHLALTHTHTTLLSFCLSRSLTHTRTLSNAQVHKLTRSHIAAKHTLCSHASSQCTWSHQYTPHTHTHTHTKAYQYGRFSSQWGVQASLTSQHNKAISPSLMKWLTQLTDECVYVYVGGWGCDRENNTVGVWSWRWQSVKIENIIFSWWLLWP